MHRTYSPLLLLCIEIFRKCCHFQLIRTVEVVVLEHGVQAVQYLIVGLMLEIHIHSYQRFLGDFLLVLTGTVAFGGQFHLTFELRG